MSDVMTARGTWFLRCRARSVVSVLLLLGAGCHHAATGASPTSGTPGVPRIPRDASRFEIVASTDSTVTFRIMEATWVRAGLKAHAVDPRQRDAIIARLTVTSVDREGAHARITGRVTDVLTDHVVLLSKAPTPWWRDRRFWLGAGAGAALGTAVGVGASVGH